MGRFPGGALAALGLIQVLAFRDASGLLLVLAGMFLAASTRAGGPAQAARDVPGGVRVRDVMTPHPVAGGTWMSVSVFTEHVVMTAFGSSQTVFPVTGPAGRLAGVVALHMLNPVPPPDRPTAPLSQIMVTVPAEYLAAPGDPAGPLLARPLLAGELAAVVTEGGQVVGIVTAVGLRQRAGRARPGLRAAREPAG